MMLKSRLLWAVCIVAAIGVITRLAAAQTAANPVFEVASVKPNKSGSTIGRINMPADRFEATGVPLRGLISLAFGEAGPPPQTRPNDQIVGGPGWVSSDFFDITAKAASDVPAGPAGVGPKLLMLRALLEDRFKLTVTMKTATRQSMPWSWPVPTRSSGHGSIERTLIVIGC